MPMTLQQLKTQLSAIEPDDSTYTGIGVAEIPLLEQLLHDPEVWMASRAVFALSRVADPAAVQAISRAAADPRHEVRVAVAASTKNLRPADANPLLSHLLADTNLGVRKFAIQSVASTHDAAIKDKLREVEARDPVPALREMAGEKLQEVR